MLEEEEEEEEELVNNNGYVEVDMETGNLFKI
jgi:hypothetical protein